jgi:hypothetical protein
MTSNTMKNPNRIPPPTDKASAGVTFWLLKGVTPLEEHPGKLRVEGCDVYGDSGEALHNVDVYQNDLSQLPREM